MKVGVKLTTLQEKLPSKSPALLGLTSLAFRIFIITFTGFNMATDDFILAPIPLHGKRIFMICIFEKIDLSIIILTTFSFQLMYFQRLIDISSHSYIF